MMGRSTGMLARWRKAASHVRLLAGLWLAALAPHPARAEWLEASSPHFLIYADDTEADIQRLSTQLERYHVAMSFVTRQDSLAPRPSNRVTVYVVRNEGKCGACTGPGNLSSPGSMCRARALNRLENDHPLPLIYFFRAYVEQGRQPTELAVQGLRRAVELAPFDGYIRFRLAREQIRARQRDEALRNLSRLAYNPHGGALADRARAVIERLDREPDWDGSGADVAIGGPDDE